MPGEEFFVTAIVLVIIAVIIYAIVANKCESFTAAAAPVAAAPVAKVDTKTDRGIITITTNKSYQGINDLVKAFNKLYSISNNAAYEVTSTDGQADHYMAIELKAAVDKSLTSSSVVLRKSYDSKFLQTYTDRATKKSMWNTDRKADVRAASLMGSLKLRVLEKALKFKPGQTDDRTYFNYYIVTKDENQRVKMLVDALNMTHRRNASNSFEMRERRFPDYLGYYDMKGRSTPSREKFIAGTMASLAPDDIHVYGNEIVNPIYKTNQINQFLRGNPPVFDIVTHLGSPNDYSAWAYCPLPTNERCDPSINHCYLLRAYVNGSDITNCKKAPARLKTVVDAYNSAVIENNNIGHPVSGKLVRFFGGITHLPRDSSNYMGGMVYVPRGDRDYDDKVSASIDSDDRVAYETNTDIDNAILKNDFTGMKERIRDFLKSNMSDYKKKRNR